MEASRQDELASVSIRSNPHRLIVDSREDVELELYWINDGWTASKNIAASNPELVARIAAELH